MPKRAADFVARSSRAPTSKRPFRFGTAIPRIRRALSEGGWADAAMFELAAQGYRTLFEQLVACVISIRTYDEVSLPTAIKLFARACTAQDVAKLSFREIDALISPSTFHEGKARQIHTIAKRVVEEFNGQLPCDFEALTSLHGVGPKCANLALGIACGQQRISVDVHVHRVTNRWGYVQARSPEQTMLALEE